MEPEPTLFDLLDPAADALALREGEEDADAGRVVPHDEVAAWLEDWGTPSEIVRPQAW